MHVVSSLLPFIQSRIPFEAMILPTVCGFSTSINKTKITPHGYIQRYKYHIILDSVNGN